MIPVSEIAIRASVPADVPGLWAALDIVARERRFLAITEPPTLAQVAAMQASPSVVQIVAAAGDHIVGWADIRRLETPGFTHRGTLGMGVVPSFRRRGLGKRLLNDIIERSRYLRVTRIELQVLLSNVVALQLYRRYGFQIEGALPAARILDGVRDDLLIMCRWNDPSADLATEETPRRTFKGGS
jgi:ribosomal protein S18 acetylase RimI-like enzyme